MKAKTRSCLTWGTFLISLIAANGIKVETSHDVFLPRSEHGAGAIHIASSAHSWASMLDVFDSIIGTPHSTVPEVEAWVEDISMAANRTKAKVPSNRQQMYFRPVSVTLQCVMLLTIASLCVYTALSISRNYDELSATFTASALTQSLTIALRVANAAPMLCMLFVACRMYVLATTEGLGEPPAWVKMCMKTAVTGMTIQFVVVVCLPVFSKTAATEEASYDMTEGKMAKFLSEHDKQPKGQTEGPVNLVDATGHYTDVHPQLTDVEFHESTSFMKYVFWAMQNLGIVLLYGSITGVIFGIYSFPVGTTKISAAVLCTVTMSKLYFLVCFALWLARALPESEFQTSCKNAALAMSGVVRKFPMFAVLFLAARMRALNLDPPHGMPPFWMQCCFYSITGLVYLETLGAAVVGFTGEMRKAYYGIYMFRCRDSKFFHYVEHLPSMAALILVIPVIYGVTLMNAADGSPAPLSTTLTCTVWFTGFFCAIAFFQALILFSEEAMGVDRPMLRDTAVSAGISLGIAPLLCVLFVATRMRALQITQQQGAPPGWAQDCMLIALFATGVQALCCLVMPIFIGSACKVDDDGNPDYDLEPMIGAYAVAIVKYVALIALHGSIIVICCAVYVMTPETAHDGGRILNNRKQFFNGVLITMGVFFVALLLSSAKVVGMAIKLAIESCDQALLGVDITIQKCALNLFKGYVNISKLKVHQPEEEIIYNRNDDGKLVGTPTGKTPEWKHDFIAKVHLVLIKINLWRLVTSLGKEFELQNLSIQGIYLNIEKPDTDLKSKNSNVEYILNHIDALGLMGSPPPKDEKADAAKKKPEEKKEDPKKPEAPVAKKAESKEEGEKPKSSFKVVLHKIAFGDMGVGVTIQNVKLIGELSFAPSIGLLVFDDIQNEVFGGRDDLEPGETVALIVKAVAAKVFKQVAHEIPRKIMESVGLGSGLSGLKESLAKSWHRMRGYHEEDDD